MSQGELSIHDVLDEHTLATSADLRARLEAAERLGRRVLIVRDNDCPFGYRSIEIAVPLGATASAAAPVASSDATSPSSGPAEDGDTPSITSRVLDFRYAKSDDGTVIRFIMLGDENEAE